MRWEAKVRSFVGSLVVKMNDDALNQYHKTFSFQNARYSKSDLDLPLKVAEKFWNPVDENLKIIISKYIKNTFNIWKLEKGLSHKLKGNEDEPLGVGIFSILGKRITEEERLEKIETKEAWECTPAWVNPNPIDLLFHIMTEDYWTLEGYDFYLAVAYLIIEAVKNEKLDYAQTIISKSLWLADFRANTLEKTGEKLFIKNKLNFEKEQERIAKQVITKKIKADTQDDIVIRFYDNFKTTNHGKTRGVNKALTYVLRDKNNEPISAGRASQILSKLKKAGKIN